LLSSLYISFCSRDFHSFPTRRSSDLTPRSAGWLLISGDSSSRGGWVGVWGSPVSVCDECRILRPTFGTCAPVHDLGLVDDEAVVVLGVQTGRVPDRTVDVLDPAAATAHEVEVVVPRAPLVPCRRTGGFDATHQADLGAHPQCVV